MASLQSLPQHLTMANPKLPPCALFLSLVLFFLLSTTASGSSRTASKVGGLQGSVMVYNQIVVHSDIKVQCQSRFKEVKIPWTTLQNGRYVGWGFKASIWGGTRFSCRFVWEAMTRWQDLDVWVDPPVLDIHDRRPCTHCVWHATLDGFKAYEAGHVLGTPVEEFKWKSGYPPWT